MEPHVRKDRALVYANVGVHADVEIALAMDLDGGEGAAIHFGHDGPDLIMDFADVDSLERLAAVAADGARRLRARLTAHDDRAAAPNADVDPPIAAGVA
ncbi:MAG: hypothetical protein GEV28_34555 [Actinophytocola sp.]|uniref:hypothetical protein n=1 Tax=Actinophytocola sp. TaxID=1872138 RepID=UPI0013218E75|nr:hypothetical protein [Actinophytocola sp.]MPZ85237.1 hypothetical protein [Actinophytocola sp.]